MFIRYGSKSLISKMEYADVLEKAHKSNLQKLLEEFGAQRMEEIHTIYEAIKNAHEGSARIRDYVPILAYRTAKEELSGPRENRA